MRILKILKRLQTTDDDSHLLLGDIKTFLSDRQYQVVKWKRKGYKNIEVAEKLKVSPATITKEIKIIKQKLRKYFLK